MKIIMAAAISKDGFIAKDYTSNISEWVSQEDAQFFSKLRQKHSLFVMGSKTYDSVRPNPSPDTLRVVLTRHPERYADLSVAGQLEFRNLSPEAFYDRYRDTYDSCLLLGGGYIYETFLEADLVDEIYLTVEPVELQSGIPLLAGGKTLDDYALTALSNKQLNEQGTVLRHYSLK